MKGGPSDVAAIPGPAAEPSCGTVLLVCTANVSRSPFAMHLLARALTGPRDAPLVRVLSAGTRTGGGQPMDARMRRELLARGVRTGDFVSRSVHEVALTRVDLVLAATREHRSQVVRLEPRLLGRAFTLRQASRLLEGVPGGRAVVGSARDLATTLAGARGQQGPSAGAADDIEDPVGRDEETYLRVIDQVVAAVHAVAGAWQPAGDSQS